MPKDATLYIHDVCEPVCSRFKDEFERKFGAIRIVPSAKVAAQNASTIISIIPTGKHVADVYLDRERGVAAAKGMCSKREDEDRLYLECSTIDIETAKAVGSKLQKAGMGLYIDSPVSGGVPAAERGDLSFILGAPDPSSAAGLSFPANVQDRLRTLVEYMGNPSKVFYCGGLGAGLAAKICNNYLSCTILLATAEAMATGIKLGLDKKLLHKVIQNSTGQSFMADNVCPVPGVVPHAPSSNGYRLGFKAQMLEKDIGLGVDAANSVGIKPSIGEAAMEVYRQVAKDERCIVSHIRTKVQSFESKP
jgi:3-hydroxyisobutyrate dehydrogenase